MQEWGKVRVASLGCRFGDRPDSPGQILFDFAGILLHHSLTCPFGPTPIESLDPNLRLLLLTA